MSCEEILSRLDGIVLTGSEERKLMEKERRKMGTTTR